MKRRVQSMLTVSFLTVFGSIPSPAYQTSSSAAWLAAGRAGSAGACSVEIPGGRVLVTGGEGSGGPLNTSQIYDAAGASTGVAPMLFSHAEHTCTLLGDGRVLVAGGRIGGAAASNVAETYDPATNAWSAAGSMLSARAGATASLLKTGDILIAGGESNGVAVASTERFNAVKNVFEFSSAILSSPRKNHAAAVLSDGRVLIAGGSNGGTMLNSVDIFDPTPGTISSVGRLSVARSGLSATTLLEGTVLLAGGASSSGDTGVAEVYDPAKGTISTTGSMVYPRDGHQAVRLTNNNSVLIVGGSSSTPEVYIPWQRIFKPFSALLSPSASARRAPVQNLPRLAMDGPIFLRAAYTAPTTWHRSRRGILLDTASNLGSAAAGYPTIVTDRSDYLPGMPVVVSGTGWKPGETVKLVFHETNAPDPDVTHQAVADGSGNISNQQFAPDSHDYGVIFTLTATGLTSALTAQTEFSDGANLDGCGNGNPPTLTCTWQNGDLGSSKALYQEGQSVPYRIVMSGLTAGSHTVVFGYDVTNSGKHAIDYVTSFDRSITGADPCSAGTLCSGAPNNFPIPVDASLNTNGILHPPISGNFSMWGGTMTGATYGLTGAYTTNAEQTISITFTVPASPPANVVLAWGDHLASRLDWGNSSTLVTINGSSYHTHFESLDGTGGNQDKALQTTAVIFLSSITVVKHANPTGSESFAFTTTGPSTTSTTSGLAPSTFSLTDNGTPANTQAYPNLANATQQTYSITENLTTTQKSNRWTLDQITCIDTDTGFNAGTVSGSTATIPLNEGQNVRCDFYNSQAAATHLKLVKDVVNTFGTAAAATNWTLSAAGPTPLSHSGGVEGDVTPGTYALSESGSLTGYTNGTTWSCSGGSQGDANHITLVAGDSATCSIVNTAQAPHLQLIKSVDVGSTGASAEPATSWMLIATGSPTSYQGAGGFDLDVNDGTYALSETGSVSGYTNGTAWSCSGGSQNGANITVHLGQTATCTIHNTAQSPQLALVKNVDAGSTGATPANPNNWNLKATLNASTSYSGNGGFTSQAVKVGTYTLSETGSVAGYANGTTWTCTVGANPPVTGLTQITLGLADSATCTITNTATAPQLALVKSVDVGSTGAAPANANNWNLKATLNASTFYSGAGGFASQVVKVGTYTLSETGSVGGYANGTTWTCTVGANPPVTGLTQITLGLGDNATCTITNTATAPQLALVKNVDVGSTGATAANPNNWNLKATLNASTSYSGAGGFASQAVKVGTYTLSETGSVAGYANGTAWSCPGFTVTGGNQITLALGDSATCTITNTATAPQLALVKNVDVGATGATPAAKTNWTLSASGPQTVSMAGGFASQAVKIGTYQLTETGSLGGYTNGTAWVCTGSGTQGDSTHITLALGQSATCTITNTAIAPLLTVCKAIVNPVFSDPGKFNLLIDTVKVVTDAVDQTCSSPIPVTVGGHTVGEAGGTGTSLSNYVASFSGDCGAGGGVTLALAQSKTCTITNTRAGRVQVIKTVAGGALTGVDSFTFQLRSGASVSAAGTTLETQVANGANNGTVNFSTPLVPGQHYQICEVVMPGWAATLPNFFAPPTPSGDNSTICTDFVAVTATTTVFNVNNIRPPGGLSRTIGFWKNWSSCTGGGQAFLLDQELAKAQAANGGLAVGNLILHASDCVKAFDILNKSTTGNPSKKMASDPLYNMAAQLLGADLNLLAGAFSCPTAADWINQAQALLVKYNFIGTGYTGKLSAKDAAAANTLATELDQFNNNNFSVCPPGPTATITVNEALLVGPDGTFTLKIDGVSLKTGTSPLTTGLQTVASTVQHLVSITGADQPTYSTAISCSGDMGTNSSGTGTVLGVTPQPGENIVCTINVSHNP